MRELPRRKPNRLAGYDYSQNGAYFVTICTKNREELFGSVVTVGATVPGRPLTVSSDPPQTVPDRPQVVLNDIGDTVETAILHNNRNDFIIDRYVIMPNHIHMIVVMSSETGDRGQRGETGDRGQRGETGDRGQRGETGDRGQRGETGDRGRSPLQTVIRNMKAYITKKIGFSPWQKSFHDHIIRNEKDYLRIAEYIESNPEIWEKDCFHPLNAIVGATVPGRPQTVPG